MNNERKKKLVGGKKALKQIKVRGGGGNKKPDL